jgi:hypothetical protein
MNLDAATIRSAAKAAGLTGIRVRKGTGCYAGAVVVDRTIDATREEIHAMITWLESIGACERCCGRTVRITFASHRFADSVGVVSFA